MLTAIALPTWLTFCFLAKLEQTVFLSCSLRDDLLQLGRAGRDLHISQMIDSAQKLLMLVAQCIQREVTAYACAESASEEEQAMSEVAERRQRLVDLFYAMDTDLNGMLDVEEFREAMRKVCMLVSYSRGGLAALHRTTCALRKICVCHVWWEWWP